MEHEIAPPSWVVSSGRAFRFRCSSCGYSQSVQPDLSPPEATDEAPAEPARPAPGPTITPWEETQETPVADLSASAEVPGVPGTGAVFLKQNGQIYMVSDWETLKRWIAESRVDRHDLVSEGGVRWEPIGSRHDLLHLFAGPSYRAPSSGTPSPAPFHIGGETPFGGESFAASGWHDDDTEGIPTGLPPLPTDEIPSPNATGFDAVGAAALRKLTPTPPPVGRRRPPPVQRPTFHPPPAAVPEPDEIHTAEGTPTRVATGPTERVEARSEEQAFKTSTSDSGRITYDPPPEGIGPPALPPTIPPPPVRMERSPVVTAPPSALPVLDDATDEDIASAFYTPPTARAGGDDEPPIVIQRNSPVLVASLVAMIAALAFVGLYAITRGPGPQPTQPPTVAAPLPVPPEPLLPPIETDLPLDTDAILPTDPPVPTDVPASTDLPSTTDGPTSTDRVPEPVPVEQPVAAVPTPAVPVPTAPLPVVQPPPVPVAPTPVPVAPVPGPVAPVPGPVVPAPGPVIPAPVVPAPVAPAPVVPAPVVPVPKGDVKVLISAGWARASSNPSAARESFGAALEIDPNNADANYGYGTMLLNGGNPSSAQPYLCKARSRVDPLTREDIDDALTKKNLTCP